MSSPIAIPVPSSPGVLPQSEHLPIPSWTKLKASSFMILKNTTSDIVQSLPGIFFLPTPLVGNANRRQVPLVCLGRLTRSRIGSVSRVSTAVGTT